MRLLSDGIRNPNFIRFVKVLIFDKSRFHFTAVDWKVIQLVIYSGIGRNQRPSGALDFARFEKI
jgi:hypothetical protein